MKIINEITFEVTRRISLNDESVSDSVFIGLEKIQESFIYGKDHDIDDPDIIAAIEWIYEKEGCSTSEDVQFAICSTEINNDQFDKQSK